MSPAPRNAAAGAVPLSGSMRALVLALFFVSGATGLVYQGVWFRHLQSLFGVTTHALAVVVAAFMGGLAGGSWLFGRIADRSPRPLRLYGLLEIGAALSAPLVVILVAAIERLYVAMHPVFSGSPWALAALRLVLALAALLGPTLLMGGTLPALTVLLRRGAAGSRKPAALHRDLGWLYGLNTLGAVLGTALVGFVLLSRLGLSRTTILAVVVNLACGLLAWWLGGRLGPQRADATAAAVGPARTLGPASETACEPASDAAPGPAALHALARYALLAFAVSGGISLAYEVAWTRALAQIIGSSTYAFSMILAAFLLGVGLGSLALGRWRGRDANGLAGFAAAQLWIAATAALVVPGLVRLPDLQLWGFANVTGMKGVLWLQFALCLVVVLLPTLGMGATFPLVAGFVAQRSRDVGRAVGRLYAANTLGGITGSMVAGFLLLPHLGTRHTLQLAIAGNLGLGLLGFWLLRRSPSAPSRSGRAALVGAVLLVAALLVASVAWLTPAWDPYLLDAGIAVGGPATSHGDRSLRAREVGRGSDILWYREGLNANISVRKDESQLYLKTNGKTDGTSRGDMPTQLQLGLLPCLLHAEPRRALVVGLGTGASARAALYPPGLEKLDVVEIEPAVVDAARTYFAEVNSGLFTDPRARIWVEDARTFLLTTPERYDVIVSEPSNPWIAGVASLFGVEHYERCAARLAPGGLVVQWLQIYAMHPDLVRMVIASVREVFPQVSVWSFHHGDLLLLASREPMRPLDLKQLDERIAAWEVEAPLRSALGVASGAGISGFHLLGPEDAARFASGARLNTEDRPRLEFAAPWSLYATTRDSNAELLLAARRRMLPNLAPGTEILGPARLDLVRAAIEARRYADAETWAREALADPGTPHAAALALSGEAALASRNADLAAARLEEALALDPASTAAARNLALLRLLQGRAQDGFALVERACAPDPARGPKEQEATVQLLELVLSQGRADLAHSGATALLATRAPDAVLHARLLGLLARAELQRRQVQDAERLAREALAQNPQCTGAWRVLGALAFESGDYPAAIRWWERCIDYRQTGLDVLTPLALACQRAGRRRDARRYAERILAQDAENPVARRILGG